MIKLKVLTADPTRRNVLPVLFALALTALLTGCGGDGSSLPSGIRGQAIREIVGGAVGLPPRDSPLPNAVISVQPAGGGPEIQRQSSDSGGNFQFKLPAGSYLLKPLLPADQQSSFSVQTQTVMVPSGSYSVVMVKYVQIVP